MLNQLITGLFNLYVGYIFGPQCYALRKKQFFDLKAATSNSTR